jgi:hypothetical protein
VENDVQLKAHIDYVRLWQLDGERF